MKECVKCGEVKEDKDFRLRKYKTASAFVQYRVKECRKCENKECLKRYYIKQADPEYRRKACERAKKYRTDNTDIYREKNKIRREKEEYKKYRREYIKKNKAKIQEQEKICKQRWHEKNRDLLTDIYVGARIVAKTDLKRDEISVDLIEVKRWQLKLIRTIKKIKNGTK